MTIHRTLQFCDSCRMAADDEAGFELDPYSLNSLLLDMGRDIADHFCDSTENGTPCDCACQSRR